MTHDNRPIGYWLKHLDQLIEGAFDAVITERGLSRRHWQVLNTVSRGPVGDDEITDALQPFWLADAVPQAEIVAELTNRGWLERDATGRLRLSTTGQAAHAALAQDVQRARRRVTAGIPDEEYTATVATLRRMAANLAPADPAPATPATCG